MVIGNGLVATGFKLFEENNEFVVFASGVSDSGNTNPLLFHKEKELLKLTMEGNQNKKLVYFSTCSIYDMSLQQSAYVLHKTEMENIIKKNHPFFHIFRISNLAGRTNNPHTILNYFIQHIKTGKFFYLWRNAYRNIIDIDHAVAACTYMLLSNLHVNETVDIANTSNYPVLEIVQAIEAFTGRKGNYALIDEGDEPSFDVSIAKKYFSKLHINFDNQYLYRILQKYYSVE